MLKHAPPKKALRSDKTKKMRACLPRKDKIHVTNHYEPADLINFWKLTGFVDHSFINLSICVIVEWELYTEDYV